MANSATTITYDHREDHPHDRPVWQTTTTFLIETGGGHAEITKTVPINGLLQEVVFEVGTTTQGSETVNIDLDDGKGVEFSANATLAESSETILSFSKPLKDLIIRCDAVDDPDSGADWEIVVTCRGI